MYDEKEESAGEVVAKRILFSILMVNCMKKGVVEQMKTVLKYIKPYRFKMLIGLLIKITGTFFDLGLPWVLAYIIDEVIPLKSVKLILFWGFIMILLSIGARQFNIIANRMAARVAGDSVRELRHDLYSKIESLSGKQVDTLSIPSLVSRMTSDTYNVHQMIGMIQRLGVRAPIIIIGGIIITMTLEPVLTLVLIVILPLLVLVTYLVSKNGIPVYMQGQMAVDQMIRTVRENISGIRVIKALSKTEYEQKRFAGDTERIVENELKAGSIMAIINPAMNFLLNIGLTLVVVVGAYRVNSGASEVGKIVAFLSYFTLILNAILMLNKIFIVLSKATSSSARIAEVLNAPEDLLVMDKEYYPDSKSEENYFIEFDKVTFSYTMNNGEPEDTTEVKNHVSNISFGMKKGEKIGIIGSTGSGKSTIINLIMRYYDIQHGAIYVDSKDIRTYELETLRSKFGVVFQNDSIFQGTIRSNIAISRDVNEDAIKRSTVDAQAHEFIVETTDGLEHIVATGGTNLSGGQKQRVLLSRALADNPEILVLDDSSSALDYKTDAALRKAINENHKDSTIIMVAQRISSIMHMEHILVLEDGETIGYGSHEELLINCDIYKEIYESQMGEK